MSDLIQTSLAAVRKSGFPFQMRVAQMIRNRDGYEVSEEVAYASPDGTAKFIDIVAVARNETRLVVECKKAAETSYTFLSRVNESDTQRLLAPYISMAPEGNSPGLALRYGDYFSRPTSFQAQYCVACTSKPGDKASFETRLLESIVQPLVEASEAHARESLRLVSARLHSENRGVPFIPLVVTTAALFVARIDPISDVDLGSGELHLKPDRIQPVNFIRFEKEFTASPYRDCRARTAIIARLEGLEELLEWLPDHSARWNQRDVVLAS